MTMLSKRNITICGIAVGLFFFFGTLTVINAADTTSQIIAHIDEILKANPLPPGEKAQTITIAQDDAISLLVLRAVEGLVIKSHLWATIEREPKLTEVVPCKFG
jgi:hypothetical protein